jgi:hypothetical protein
MAVLCLGEGMADDWPITDVAAYRSQSDAEFGFRQLKDPHTVSFSPMNHCTDQAIRVHTYTRVLALQLAHVMRRRAHQAGLDLSVRAVVDARGLHRRNRPDPPLRGWASQSPQDAHRDNHRPEPPDQHIRPTSMGTTDLGHTPNHPPHPR